MKLNFDFTMQHLDGITILDENGVEIHAGRALARLIMNGHEGGPDIMTRFDWANQLYNSGTIDLDKAGRASFKKVIEQMPNVPLIMRGQLLQIVDGKEPEAQ